MFYSKTHSYLLLPGCSVEQRHQLPRMRLLIKVRIGYKEGQHRINGLSLHCLPFIILLSVIVNITDSNTICQELSGEKWVRRRTCFLSPGAPMRSPWWLIANFILTSSHRHSTMGTDF